MMVLFFVAEKFKNQSLIVLCNVIVSCIYKYKLESYFKILQGEILTGARFIFAGLKTNITSIKSIDKLRVVLTDEAENISQTSWDYLRPTPRYGQVRFYIVFNPRFRARRNMARICC